MAGGQLAQWMAMQFLLLEEGIVVVVFIKKYPVQDDEYNYIDSLHARLIGGI